MQFPQQVLVCTCRCLKRRHFIAKFNKGPCLDCPCLAFIPEPTCKCGHGKKAHEKSRTGHCHECTCKVFH